MRKDVMKKWVQALRSGKFKQGTGTLKQFNSKGDAQHCCLGVLCELYNKEMKKNKKKTLSEKVIDGCDFAYGATRFDRKSDDLPKLVREWAGMNNSLGTFTDSSGELNTLADLNDCGKKFKTIADIIEKNYEVL
jgi:hypothetical protein